MGIHQELSGVGPHQETVLTIGVFDGVHLGHQCLLQRLVQKAQHEGRRSAVLTFRTHPRSVIQRGTVVRCITSTEERLRLLRDMGVDLVIPVTFDQEVAQLRARQFAQLLMDRLGMRGLVVGPDFAMGNRREGDIPTLRRLGQEMGFSVEVVEARHIGDIPVRSSVIRQTLESGDVTLATRLLGRPFRLDGAVTRGRGRGRALGFPTANLDVDPIRLIPGDGVYATWAYIDDQRHPSATNVGTRPTFGEVDRTVETYLLDFNDDLYGSRVQVEFVRRLRDELRFDSPEALRIQMEKDVVEARSTLQAARATAG